MKKILLIFFLFLLFYSFTLLLLTKSVFAAATEGIPLPVTSSNPIGASDINLHSWTQISSLDIVSSLTCQIIGYDPAKPDGSGCVFYGEKGQLQAMTKPGGGAVAFTGNLIAAMYANPPASGVQYLADLGKNLGIVKPAYAQMGTGWTGLTPILPIWKAFRNIAYLFFTLIFIAIGFAIMFRVKISPQAVVTIQSAIPRIVLTLILVTFSYAIAGFLIDLMYVILNIFIFALVNTNLIDVTKGEVLFQRYISAGLLETMGIVMGKGGTALREFVSQFWIPTAIGAGIVSIIAVIIGLAVSGAALAGMALPVVFGLAISLLVFLFRILFMLIKAYAFVMLLIIFGPLVILVDALPGQPGGFSQWLLSLVSNLSVFLVTAFLFIFLDIILMVIPGDAPLWGPPFIGPGGQTLRTALSLGILLIIPNVVQVVQALITRKGAPTLEMRSETALQPFREFVQRGGEAIGRKYQH